MSLEQIPLSMRATDELPMDTIGSQSVVDDTTAYHEGGYGWIVTAASFILMFTSGGSLYAWGVFQSEFVHRGLGSSLAVSAVGAVSACCYGIGCLPASKLAARPDGLRRVALLGTITASLSFILASFSIDSFVGLIILHGFMYGIGGSFAYLVAFTAPSQWFIRRRGLVTGFSSCGAGIGAAVISIVTQRMVKSVGLAWTYRCLGLAMGACGAYIPQYAESIGLSASQGAFYSSMYNISSAVGRVSFGLIADLMLGNMNAWSISTLLIALSSLLIWPRAVNQGLVILFVVLNGAGAGGFFSLQASVMGQIVGDRRLQVGMGWLEVSQSLGFLAGPLSAGALLDAFGGPNAGPEPYRPAIYLVGATTALAWILMLSVRMSSSRRFWHKV